MPSIRRLMAGLIGAVPSADAAAVSVRLRKMEARSDELKRDLDTAKGEMSSLRKNLAHAEGRIQERDEQVRAHERTAAQLQSELQALRSKLAALEEAHREALAGFERERLEAGDRVTKLTAKYEARRVTDREYVEKAREQLKSALESVRGKVARNDWAERGAIRATEHLMAIEVKLDLLEAAVQTLDRRTRAALSGSTEPVQRR